MTCTKWWVSLGYFFIAQVLEVVFINFVCIYDPPLTLPTSPLAPFFFRVFFCRKKFKCLQINMFSLIVNIAQLAAAGNWTWILWVWIPNSTHFILHAWLQLHCVHSSVDPEHASFSLLCICECTPRLSQITSWWMLRIGTNFRITLLGFCWHPTES